MNIEIALNNINGKDVPAVTSLQVAEAFGKEHFNVLRDIETILLQVPENFRKLNFEVSEYTIQNPLTGGELPKPMYLLTKDAFTLLTMGYTGEKAMAFKVAYIARFNEMEKALQANAPTSLPEALRAYANMLEENELIRRQRDEAIRTKAWISDKKTATAMATASVAVRKVNALEDELGRGKRYKSVKAIPWLLTEFVESKGMYSVVGKAHVYRSWLLHRENRHPRIPGRYQRLPCGRDFRIPVRARSEPRYARQIQKKAGRVGRKEIWKQQSRKSAQSYSGVGSWRLKTNASTNGFSNCSNSAKGLENLHAIRYPPKQGRRFLLT